MLEAVEDYNGSPLPCDALLAGLPVPAVVVTGQNKKRGSNLLDHYHRSVSRFVKYPFMDIRCWDVPSVNVDRLDLQRRRSEHYPKAKRARVCFSLPYASILPLQPSLRPRNVGTVLTVPVQGIDPAKLRTIVKIKSERGARVGRYIIASTTAKYQVPSGAHLVNGVVAVRKKVEFWCLLPFALVLELAGAVDIPTTKIRTRFGVKQELLSERGRRL